VLVWLLITTAGVHANPHDPLPNKTASTPVGTIPATFRVDDSGAARVSIPIEVPPAARGVQPQLSLEYDSQLGNGPLGVGWQLGGLSAITRCAHSLAVDGEVSAVRMTNDDGLCLDGERLMLTAGGEFEVGAVYRPRRDDLTQIRGVAVAASETSTACHGLGFEARRRDGSIVTYGCRRDAVIQTHLGVHTWMIAQIRDRFGNTIDYRYSADSVPVTNNQEQLLGEADVDHVLVAIDYGGHLDLHPSTRSIRLDWEARPDPASGYRLGAAQRRSTRLREISTHANGTLAHRYELDYDAPSITGRSLLHAVRQCDAEGVCKPDTTFEYELGELAVEPLADQKNFQWLNYWPFMDSTGDGLVATPLVLNQTLLDANGDGRTDMLLAAGDNDEVQPAGRGWELWTSQPNAVTPGGNACGTSLPNSETCAASGKYLVYEDARTGSLAANNVSGLNRAMPPLFATDYDGDGRDDAIALGPNNIYNGGAPPSGTRFYIARGKAEGGVEQTEFDPKVGIIWWFTASDQTGDGLGDLLFCSGKPWLNHLNQPEIGTGTWFFIPNVPGTGFSVANRVNTGVACSAYDKFLHFDHDGDGVPSLLVIPVWDAEFGDWIPSQLWSNYHALRLDPNNGWAGTLEDTGLPPDLAQRWRADLTAAFNAEYLDVDFPKSLQGFGIDKILDVNGDGLPDVLRYELDVGDTPAQLATIKHAIVALEPSEQEWGGVRLWLNTGAGFRDGGWLMQAQKPGNYFFRRFLASGVVDYDGDGRADYLTPVDDPNSDYWNWSIWTSLGDGSFVERPEVMHAPVWVMTHNARSMGAFDLDGDGLHDIGLFHDKSWLLWEHAGAAPDKLVRLRDGLGATHEVDYRSIADFDAPEGFYELESNWCFSGAYPTRCERDPTIVVERHRLDSGTTGKPRVFEHRYNTLRSDRERGRALGFNHHETIELAETGEPIVRRVVYFNHTYDDELRDFPYAGVPRLVIEDKRDPSTGRHRVTTHGRSFAHVQTTPQTYYRYVGQEVAYTYELPGCASAPFCNPFLELDADHRVSGLVETVFEVDEYGNPLLRTSSASTGTSTLRYQTTTTYKNHPNAWLLGLPTHEKVVFTQTGVVKREREQTASYDPATGALLNRTLEPNKPELYLHEIFHYDAHGNSISLTAVDSQGELRASSASYDEHGVFPIESVNALGHQSQLRWDPALGVPVEARDPNDVRIVVDYDGLGHVTGVRTFAGETPRGDETTLTYAALADGPDGPVFEIRAKTEGHGYTVSEFDRLGRVVTERALGLDKVERFVALEYDSLGRLRASSLPTRAGQQPAGWETYEHDFADRLTTHTLPDGTQERWTHYGLITDHLDIGGSTSRLRYDTASRLVESIRGLGTPDEEQLCFDYGAFELLETVRPNCVARADANTIDPGEAPPTPKLFLYDDRGQLIASDDPSEGQRSYLYNGHGELAVYVDGNGDEVTYTRDLLGRVTARSDFDGVTKWTWDTAFLGALSSSASPSGHEELLGYDSFGRLAWLSKIIHGEAFDLEFEYDAFDRLASLHYPTVDEQPNYWIRNVYAANGQLRAVRSGPDNSLLWRAEALSDDGQLAVERFGDKILTQRSYNPLRGFVESIQTSSNLGGAIQHLGYQWNADGTLHQRHDTIHHQSEVMTYDALHRVASVHTSKGQQQHTRHFAYDSLGNLVYATDRGEYDYDSAGRLALAGGNAHQWDANGNLIARTGADPANLYYTAFDKLAEIETATGAIVFEYDAAHQRVYRYAEAEARETVYVTDLYQRQRDDDTGETQHHYYVPGLERIVADVVDTVDGFGAAERAIHFIHVDHLGSTDAVSDSAGMVEQRMSYDLWGKRRDPSNWTSPDEFLELGPINLGYTGHEAQDDGGLINMRGRMYDPHLGRMASADPFVVDPTSTQGWNRYAYVLNRPLSLTDPSGFAPAPDQYEVFADGLDVDGHAPAQAGFGGAEGMAAASQVGQSAAGNTQAGGESTPKANQQAGDQGPAITLDNMGDAALRMIKYGIDGGGGGGTAHPLDGFANAMFELRPMGPSQERRRDQVSQEVGARVTGVMQDPPAYVKATIAVTLFMLGDAELLLELGHPLVGRIALHRAEKALVQQQAKKAQRLAANQVAGRVGEAQLTREFGGASQVVRKTSLGRRVIDNLAKGVARESKVGRVAHSSRVRLQIAKDIELMNTTGTGVHSVEWHFFPGKTGTGPTAPLRAALEDAGISIVIH